MDLVQCTPTSTLKGQKNTPPNNEESNHSLTNPDHPTLVQDETSEFNLLFKPSAAPTTLSKVQSAAHQFERKRVPYQKAQKPYNGNELNKMTKKQGGATVLPLGGNFRMVHKN